MSPASTLRHADEDCAHKPPILGGVRRGYARCELQSIYIFQGIQRTDRNEADQPRKSMPNFAFVRGG